VKFKIVTIISMKKRGKTRAWGMEHRLSGIGGIGGIGWGARGIWWREGSRYRKETEDLGSQ